MKQSNILILLVVFTLLVNFNNYIDIDETKDIKKIEAISKRIESEKSIVQEKKKFKEAKQNLSIFFSSELDNSIALGKFQKSIKKMATESKFKISNISWGEPTINKKLNLEILPLKVVAKSEPHAFSIFADKILTFEKLIKIDMITVRKNRKKISYNMYLFAYKRLKQKSIDEK